MKVHANGAHGLKERLKVTTSGSPRLLDCLFEPLGAEVSDALEVMHKAEEQPLDVDLGLAAIGEVVHSFLHPDIGEDRFDHRQALRIDRATLRYIDFRSHLATTGCGAFGRLRHVQAALFCAALETVFAERTAGTVFD